MWIGILTVKKVSFLSNNRTINRFYSAWTIGARPYEKRYSIFNLICIRLNIEQRFSVIYTYSIYFEFSENSISDIYDIGF